MSETEHYKGTLTKVKRLENESLEEQCKRLLEYRGLLDYDSYEEMLLDEFYKEYYVYNGILYSIHKESINSDGDIFNADEGENGVINFEVRYYNDGCGFNEAIEEALENIEIKINKGEIIQNMNKEFIIECIDIIEQIKQNSIVAITKDNEELKYQVNCINEYGYTEWELTCLDEENAIWDCNDTLEDIKESLVCNAVRSSYQKIRFVKE